LRRRLKRDVPKLQGALQEGALTLLEGVRVSLEGIYAFRNINGPLLK